MSMVGVILAGGKSTRMKQDKALLNLGGVSLLQRQFDLLEDLLGSGQVIVSGDRPPFPHLRDRDQGLGPLEGLRSVADHLLKETVMNSLLVVPVDMPFLTPLGLSRLMASSEREAVTKFKGWPLPLVIHDLSQVLKALDEVKLKATSESDLSFRQLYKKVSVQEIEAESDSFFANLNTPEDWNAALS